MLSSSDKTHDCTTSKLRELFSQNPKGITLYCDELKGQLQKLDKSGNEGDRSFYISCWSGQEYYNKDRILKGSNVSIPLTLSWIGCIPPESLSVYLRQAMSDGYDADGLLQRFQLMTFPDFHQEYQICKEAISEKILSDMQELFCKIDAHTRASPTTLRFSPAGQKAFDDWHIKNENDCRNGDHPLYWESHLGKYPKLFASLCVNLHTTILDCNSVAEAAKRAQISESRLWEWLKDEDFQNVLNTEREVLFRESLAKIKSGTVRATDTLLSLLDSEDERLSRLKAIQEGKR